MPKNEIVYVRFTKAEKKEIKDAAEEEYMTVSGWVRKVLLKKIRGEGEVKEEKP